MKTVCKNLLAALALCVAPLPSFSGNNAESQTPTVRILAVGNSFSEDAIDQYFHELCEAAGKRVIIGNLYIGGCSLERHLLNARTDSAAYRFRRIGHDGVTITANPVTLSSALQSDDWNYVSFQQASPLSGKYGSYADLKPLIAYADNVTQGRPTYMWQQTWAYSPTSTHGAFPTYNSDQKVMYDSIMSATRRVMTDYPSLKVLIPTGTAVQTARIASGNYDLTRDGRYIAACTWFEAIFGESVIGNPYHPAGMTDEQARMAQEAAHSACEAMK